MQLFNLDFVILHYNIGDGGEDICCTLDKVHLTPTSASSDETGKFSQVEASQFLEEIKTFFVSKLVFPRLSAKLRYVCVYFYISKFG